MSKYTEVLEFFMENGISLNRDQMDNLKTVCTEGFFNKNSTSSYMQERIKKENLAREKFEKDFKITNDVLDLGIIQDYFTSKKEFLRIMNLNKGAFKENTKAFILETIGIKYGSTDKSELLKILKDEYKKQTDKDWKEIIQNNIELINAMDRVIPLVFDTDSMFYDPGKNIIYMMDYKARTYTETVDKYLERIN